MKDTAITHKKDNVSVVCGYGYGMIARNLVVYATFNNISVLWWRSVLLVEETEVPGENHPHVASHWRTLSHNVVSSTPRHEQDSNSQR